MRILIEAANATIGIEDGIVVAPSGRFDHVIAASDGELRPGLINAHDHLHRNHYGRLGNPPYANAYDWARDIQCRHAAEIARGREVPRRRALLIGAWKNLLSAVTHVVHHDPWEADFEGDFPLEVVRLACADSLGMTPDFSPPSVGAFALHIAEGVDARAAEEVRALAKCNLLSRNLLAVHAVGVDPESVTMLRAADSAVVWCPTSNLFLFGRTVPDVLLEEGMDVLVGSDSLLTGAGTLLDELRAARGTISDARLIAAVGVTAALRLGIPAPSIVSGEPADLAVFRRPLLEASLNDILLVMAAGEMRVVHPDFAAKLGIAHGRIVTWRGVRRWIDEDAPLLTD